MDTELLNANQKENERSYSKVELICTVMSRQFSDSEVIFGGIGNAFMALSIAKLLYVPNAVVQTEAGYIDFTPVSIFVGPGDNLAGTRATTHQGIFKTLCDLQSGTTDVSCLGVAQMDKFGNVNNSFIDPDIMMNGSGGGGDISSSSDRTLYIAEFSSRLFKKRVDYITNPGFFDGSADARAKNGLIGGGPWALVTDRGIFRFDEETKEIYLAEVFPWQDNENIRQLKSEIPWDLKISDNISIIAPPTDAEIKMMYLLDSAAFYTSKSPFDRPVFKQILAGKADSAAYRAVADSEMKKIEKMMGSML